MQEKLTLDEKTVPAQLPSLPPRLGFLGLGWIGRNRLEVITRHQAAQVVYVADTLAANAGEALKAAPQALIVSALSEMLTEAVDGVVIATPSAMHAEQSIKALEAGKAVFCQKPLGRSYEETRRVVEAARAADKLLGVDLSYRYTQAMQHVYQVVQSGQLGDIYAVELTFHNAYGPDKPWFYDPRLSGGGCLIDLGVHLVDLAWWCLDFPQASRVSGSLYSKGKRLAVSAGMVEDYATASIELQTGTHVQLACSWHLPAGEPASIKAAFYGTRGGVAFKNVGGSFYDFTAERYHGTQTEILCMPPDDWAGKAALDWAARLAAGEGFSPRADEFLQVAALLDKIYGR